MSVFLFKNRKRIRIYDMEGEEEEEEDTLDSSGFSASMDVNSSQISQLHKLPFFLLVCIIYCDMCVISIQ